MRELTLLMFLILAMGPSIARASNVGVDNYGTGAVVITGNTPGAPDQSARHNVPVVQWHHYRTVDIVDGQMCWAYRSTTDASEAAAYRHVYSPDMVQRDRLAQLAECPRDAAAAAPPTPGELARNFWDVRHLPSPTLDVVPDYAVAGKRVYLTIKGSPTADFHVPNPLGGDVSIVARSTYVVDWGDGTQSTATASQGGPWPNGDVTHVYDKAGATVTITVTQVWSATWAAPPAAGALENLRTAGSLAVPVREIQAVRNR